MDIVDTVMESLRGVIPAGLVRIDQNLVRAIAETTIEACRKADEPLAKQRNWRRQALSYAIDFRAKTAAGACSAEELVACAGVIERYLLEGETKKEA